MGESRLGLGGGYLPQALFKHYLKGNVYSICTG